jgi:Ca2+:H+ antiporter
MNFLLLAVPLSLLLAYVVHAPALWVFFSAVAAIVPLAEWIRKATEQLAKLAGPAIGGLLSVTFGNMAELILGIFVLRTGDTDVVKGQITGAIIGNGLLGLGLSIVVGTWGREKQSFQRQQAGLLSSLLMLSVIALMVPALFDYTERGIFHDPNPEPLNEHLSLGVSSVLVLVYLANLFYTLSTHRDAFAIEHESSPPEWSAWLAVSILIVATAFTAWEAELVSDALEASAARLGVTTFFLGIIVLAIVGNVAEYLTAVYFARHDRMDLSMSITLGSTIQVALLVAPLLVLISYFMGTPMDLVFANPLELIAIAAVAFIVNAIAHDGEATWFEGAMLLSVYAILGMAFFFVKS